MEIQFKDGEDGQPKREDAAVTDTKNGEKGRPQGREGDPNIRLAKRDALENETVSLDRRPYDVASGDANTTGDERSSAIAGIRSDQQDAGGGDSHPLAEDPELSSDTNHNKDKDNDGDE